MLPSLFESGKIKCVTSQATSYSLPGLTQQFLCSSAPSPTRARARGGVSASDGEGRGATDRRVSSGGSIDRRAGNLRHLPDPQSGLRHRALPTEGHLSGLPLHLPRAHGPHRRAPNVCRHEGPVQDAAPDDIRAGRDKGGRGEVRNLCLGRTLR
ncbi:hypothetical protein QJS04_geneDACA005413 [Acorus gramineus]|uniref:Uncharacterized protein n=1 Tax=Acorus gramineus TaxID=55184 RepID=A0AAV9A5U8_ACOGR|nr:hypothetical protein QJS04_geneDACA005413 [Acorus gramineus]